jgi:antitoxin VapB
MGLNIKNAEAERLAKELAELTGESLTGAIAVAVRERLERIRRERGEKLADKLLAIGRDCASRLKEPYKTVDHGELLYDERGLPK